MYEVAETGFYIVANLPLTSDIYFAPDRKLVFFHARSCKNFYQLDRKNELS